MLRYREKYKRIPHPGGDIRVPVYGWYKVTENESISKEFSIGKCAHNIYVLYHTETLCAISLGLKSQMAELARELKTFTFDGIDTWKKDTSTVRSLTKLNEYNE